MVVPQGRWGQLEFQGEIQRCTIGDVGGDPREKVQAAATAKALHGLLPMGKEQQEAMVTGNELDVEEQ